MSAGVILGGLITPLCTWRQWAQGSLRPPSKSKRNGHCALMVSAVTEGGNVGFWPGLELKMPEPFAPAPAARSRCVLRPSCATPRPRLAQEKLWFAWSSATPSARCSPAPSSTRPTPSLWVPSRASASGGEDRAGSPGGLCSFPGEVGLGWAATRLAADCDPTQGRAADPRQGHRPGRGAAAPAVRVAGGNSRGAGAGSPAPRSQPEEELRGPCHGPPGLYPA